MAVVEYEVTPDEGTLREILDLPETEEPPTREQVLLAAADLIEAKGWTTGSMEYEGAYCMAGAVAMALHGRVDFYYADARWVVPRADAERLIGADYEDIYRLNDGLPRRSCPPRSCGAFARRAPAASGHFATSAAPEVGNRAAAQIA